MKHYSSSSLWILLLFLVGGCSEGVTDKERVPDTVLEGTLVGDQEGAVELLDRKGCFTYADSIIASDTLENGHFRMRFWKGVPRYFRFETPSEGALLYLRPGDSLVINRDAHGNYRFRGKGSYINRYIRKRKAFKDSIGRVQDTIFEAPKADFFKALEERREAGRSFRNSYFKAHQKKLGRRFRKLERMRDRVDLAIIRFSYPDIYSYEHPNDSLALSPSYWSFLDSIDMNDTLMLEVPEYLSFAYDVANKYTLDNKNQARNMAYREMLFGTIRDEFEGKVEEALLTYFILEQIRYSEKRVQDSLLERYREQVRDPAMRAFVEERLRKKEGKPSL